MAGRRVQSVWAQGDIGWRKNILQPCISCYSLKGGSCCWTLDPENNWFITLFHSLLWTIPPVWLKSRVSVCVGSGLCFGLWIQMVSVELIVLCFMRVIFYTKLANDSFFYSRMINGKLLGPNCSNKAVVRITPSISMAFGCLFDNFNWQLQLLQRIACPWLTQSAALAVNVVW